MKTQKLPENCVAQVTVTVDYPAYRRAVRYFGVRRLWSVLWRASAASFAPVLLFDLFLRVQFRTSPRVDAPMILLLFLILSVVAGIILLREPKRDFLLLKKRLETPQRYIFYPEHVTCHIPFSEFERFDKIFYVFLKKIYQTKHAYYLETNEKKHYILQKKQLSVKERTDLEALFVSIKKLKVKKRSPK